MVNDRYILFSRRTFLNCHELYFTLDVNGRAVPPPLSRCDTDVLIAEATEAIAQVAIEVADAELERPSTDELLKPPTVNNVPSGRALSTDSLQTGLPLFFTVAIADYSFFLTVTCFNLIQYLF